MGGICQLKIRAEPLHEQTAESATSGEKNFILFSKIQQYIRITKINLNGTTPPQYFKFAP